MIFNDSVFTPASPLNAVHRGELGGAQLTALNQSLER